jgi:hypothetical protein
VVVDHLVDLVEVGLLEVVLLEVAVLRLDIPFNKYTILIDL